MPASNDNHAPASIEPAALAVFILGVGLVVGIPCVALWLMSLS